MSQQFVILSREPATDKGMVPIGTRCEILKLLSQFNTAPEFDGDEVLYGPGIRIELPPGQDQISQMLMYITEEEIAWLVVMRLARELKWKILDPSTGRELSP
ncbi:MAG: hypothetical protein O7G85_10545 [Planctomycetota bacterium]|nr:hypothetical protein [Planctomycetota bacterium]